VHTYRGSGLAEAEGVAARSLRLSTRDTANTRRSLALRGPAQLTPDPDLAYGGRLVRKYGQDLRRMLSENALRR